jgi:hypothetical protein
MRTFPPNEPKTEHSGIIFIEVPVRVTPGDPHPGLILLALHAGGFKSGSPFLGFAETRLSLAPGDSLAAIIKARLRPIHLEESSCDDLFGGSAGASQPIWPALPHDSSRNWPSRTDADPPPARPNRFDPDDFPDQPNPKN